jgi:hypothetical protein
MASVPKLAVLQRQPHLVQCTVTFAGQRVKRQLTH